jgi:hypothetical protein
VNTLPSDGLIRTMLRLSKVTQLSGVSLGSLFELETKTLQNALIDPDKLERLLQVKRIQKEEATNIEDTERLVTEEIEMLKVVFCIYGGKKKR